MVAVVAVANASADAIAKLCEVAFLALVLFVLSMVLLLLKCSEVPKCQIRRKSANEYDEAVVKFLPCSFMFC